MSKEYVDRRLKELGLERRTRESLARPPLETEARIKRREWERAYREKYRKLNAGLFAYHTALRHARKMQRRPPWADVKAIRALYKKAREISVRTGIKHHVDHIVPLISEVVSGLHVSWNLRIIPAEQNVRKSNHIPELLLFSKFNTP